MFIYTLYSFNEFENLERPFWEILQKCQVKMNQRKEKKKTLQ